MYILLFPYFGFLGALTGSMLFLSAPYHAAQIYVRGSVGEYWAVAFIPLVLLGMYGKKPVIGSIGLAGVIASHAILGYLTAVVLGISAVVQIFRNHDTNALKIIALGLGMSSFFWLPAWRELPYTSVSKMITGASTAFFDHFVCLGQLWNSPWGFGGSAPGCVDGMSFKLGKVQIVTFLVACILMVFPWKRVKIHAKPLARIGTVIALVSIFLTLEFSETVWRIFPFTDFIQYPWRMLSFAAVGMAVSGAYAVSAWRIPLVRIGLTVIVVWGTIFLGVKIFQPQYVYDRRPSEFESVSELRYRVSKISDEYMPTGFFRPATLKYTASEPVDRTTGLGVAVEKDFAIYKRVSIDTPVPMSYTVRWNIAHFPGWTFFVNENKVKPEINSALPYVTVPQGKSIIEARLTDTPIRTLANFITIITVIIIIFSYGKKTKA